MRNSGNNKSRAAAVDAVFFRVQMLWEAEAKLSDVIKIVTLAMAQIAVAHGLLEWRIRVTKVTSELSKLAEKCTVCLSKPKRHSHPCGRQTVQKE